MSTIAPHPDPIITTPVGPTKRWTIAEFDDLVRKGFIREGSKTYLWDGEIIEPMSENQPHVNAFANLGDLIRPRFPTSEWTVNQGNPIVLREGFKPQPDLSVMYGPRARYRIHPPSAADVALLVEIADTSYPQNAGSFLRAYAEARIPHYWIVNITQRRVEVYSMPGEAEDGTSRYAVRHDHGLDATVPLTVSRDTHVIQLGAIPVMDILRDSLEPDAEGAGA
jgi:Uma2 family endonuclease